MSVTDASQAGHFAQAAGGATRTGRGPMFLVLFLVSAMLPIQLFVGSLRVDPYRTYLLIAFIPLAVALVSGRAGRVNLVDGLMTLYAVWIVVALVYNHGNWGITNGGITVVELLGGYMLGRILVRSQDDYRRFVHFMLVIMVVLAPFVAHEFFTGRWLIGDYLGRLFPIVNAHGGERMGFTRVQATFPHPILYGLYASIVFASVYYLYRERLGIMLRRLTFVGLMTFASLSSGPLLSLAVQGGLMLWDRLTRGRWMLLLILGIIGYVVVDILSNRTPVQIFVQTFTLNPTTAYWRIHIFEYGSQAALNNPIFGIGHHDHPRPHWLTESVDNFWLVNAMRYGLVGFGFLAGAISLHVLNILRQGGLSARVHDVRLGYLIGLAGLAFTLSTVHVWNSISSLVMVYIGAGAFLYTGGHGDDGPGDTAPAPAPAGADAPRYSRGRPDAAPDGAAAPRYSRPTAPETGQANERRFRR